MAKRSPRFTETEMHALLDGCIKRWNVLCCNVNTDMMVQTKENAWREIEAEVACVSTVGVLRKWIDLRRKVQVERSNVKRKIQEIRRKRGITGNSITVPGLSDLECKTASLLTSEEVIGIENYTPLGFENIRTETEDVMVTATSSVDSIETEQILQTPHGVIDIPQIETKKRKATNSGLQTENARLHHENLKLQREVLLLQKEYYTRKLAKLDS